MTVPFSDVSLSLKQVDVSALGKFERDVLNATLAAYGFSFSEDDINRGTSNLSQLFAGADVQFDSSGGRRFAGDRTLPRTRYFSILDSDGSDAQTLLREMSAYLTGSTYPGLVSLFDTDGANTMELLEILASIPKRNYQDLDLSVPSLLIAIRPLTADPLLANSYGKSRQYVVQIPYKLINRTIAGVLDLRETKARKWLIKQFNGTIRVGNEDFPVLLGRNKLKDFKQLLPSLFDQWLGGGWTTGSITGVFARQAGASGLVYPSARSNPYVEILENNVTKSSGWCFVSYEDAPKMEIDIGVSIASDGWPTRIGWSPQNVGWVHELIPLKNVEIEYNRSGPRAGSFAVRGLSEYNSAVYRLSQVTMVFKSLDAELGDDVSSRLIYMALYSKAEDLGWIAGVLHYALLGDARSLDDLRTAAIRAGSDYERNTYADAQRLIELVPSTFRATASLAKAFGFS